MKSKVMKILSFFIISLALIMSCSVKSYSAPTSGNTNYDKTYRAVTVAKKQLGVRYKLANNATDPRVGYLDFSGLMVYSWKQVGVTLPRTAHQQRHHSRGTYYTNKWGKVASSIVSRLKVGDLIFFQTDKDANIDHVGMYIGSGKMVHASSVAGKVVTESLYTYVNKSQVLKVEGWRRLLPY